MKTIPLRELPGEPGTEPLRYSQVLGEVIRRPLDPRQGITLDEMRQSLRVLDALEVANGALELEDADYQHLKTKLLAMPWNLVDRRIVTLVDDVAGAV
jgi:hypothetical protein